MGWDESMHAQLPALQILFAARDGAFSELFAAVHGCDRYPIVVPALLAVLQGFAGVSEHACRVLFRLLWALTCFAVFLCGRAWCRAQAEQSVPEDGSRALAPWIALAAAAFSPLGTAYSGTLFLEVPFALFAALAARASIARTGAASACAAGIWATLALFTKFNYGLLLLGGLGLDLLLSRGRMRAAAAFLAVPLAGLAWWLLWPIPEGFERAAMHRAALLDFLTGNLDHPATPHALRWLHWAAFAHLTPRVFLLCAIGALLIVRRALDPGTRTLWILFLSLALPIALHPFHQDRFLLVPAPFLWLLGAAGWSSVIPWRLRTLTLGIAGVAAATIGRGDVFFLAERLELLPAEPAAREHARETIAGWSSLSPGRELPTAGLRRIESETLLEAIDAASLAQERIGWVGISSELSPGAVWTGLYERSRTPEERRALSERLRHDAPLPFFVTMEGRDPLWSDDKLREFAESFDVLFATDPPDLKDRPGRRFAETYRTRLEGLGWESSLIGLVQIQRPLGPPLDVRVLALRQR